MIKKILMLVVILMIVFMSTIIATALEDKIVKAEVIEMIQSHSVESNLQIAKLKILEGEYQNAIINVESLYIDYSQYSFDLQKGSQVFLKVNKDDNGNINAYIVNICRQDYLKKLGILFLLAVILFGRLKGMLSVTSLGVSGIIILKFMIPYIKSGYNPIFIAIITSIAIILISFVLISGFTRKSMVAILGTVGGTIIAGLLAQVFTNLCAITGLADEEVNYLITQLGMEIDYRGLYLSGVLIGSIGVVMDVAMTITSVIFELKKQCYNVGFAKLISSGLEVGKDVMATMVNTLILAYVGGAMPLFLVIESSNIGFHQTISMEIISMEIIRSLCGSIGLILTIPLTSLIASIMTSITNRRNLY